MIRILLAICHNGPVVQTLATRSLIEIAYGDRIPRVKAECGIEEIALAWFTMFPRVDALRDSALVQAMKDGFTHVVFLDADMVFPTDVLAQLLRHLPSGAIVSGFYVQRQGRYAPIALRDGVPHESGGYTVYRHDNDYRQVGPDGLRHEAVVGMGCTLVPLSIVRAIGPRPWFVYKDNVEGWPLVSEDVAFCERVTAAGFRVCLDPAIQCGHLMTSVADERYWLRYVESQKATASKFDATVVTPPQEVPA